MNNTELTLDQLKTMSGGGWMLLLRIGKAFVEGAKEIDDVIVGEPVPDRVNDPWFVEASVKEGGCEDPNFPSIG